MLQVIVRPHPLRVAVEATVIELAEGPSGGFLRLFYELSVFFGETKLKTPLRNYLKK